MALIPQSVTYLDPLMKVGAQVVGATTSKADRRDKEAGRKEIFKRLELDEKATELYPFELSGGMARRVIVSTAILSQANLIIADEPTPGMSVSQAVEALKIFRELSDEGKGVLLITHDIDLALEVADKIAVFYAGSVLEEAKAEDFKRGVGYLRHPYTKALWEALPQNSFKPIPGFQPFSMNLPEGCLFYPRCPQKTKKCLALPEMVEMNGGKVRCWHADRS